MFFRLIEGVSITLGGQAQWIPRARLGLHIKLLQLVEEFEQAPGHLEMAKAISDYLLKAGVEVGAAGAAELLIAFYQLKQLNSWQWQPLFMRSPAEKKQDEPYDYTGRTWVWMVHKLAQAYGWSQSEIFALYPEEVAAYLQEILISDIREAEERYSLSELAYQYDKNSRTSRYIPYPKPGWMFSQEMPLPVRVLRSMLPYGVKDLAGNEKMYH